MAVFRVKKYGSILTWQKNSISGTCSNKTIIKKLIQYLAHPHPHPCVRRAPGVQFQLCFTSRYCAR